MGKVLELLQEGVLKPSTTHFPPERTIFSKLTRTDFVVPHAYVILNLDLLNFISYYTKPMRYLRRQCFVAKCFQETANCTTASQESTYIGLLIAFKNLTVEKCA